MAWLVMLVSACHHYIVICIDLPVEVDNFHTLVPLEPLADPSRVGS
jgi:hypothetical protein